MATIPAFSPSGRLATSDDTYFRFTNATNETVSWSLAPTNHLVSKTDSLGIYNQDAAPADIFFRPDGLKMYMLGGSSDVVYQYTLTTAWDISTATYDGVSFSFAGLDTITNSISFRSDGLKMYMLGSTNDSVYQYTLTTAWDLSTATHDVTFSITGQDTVPAGLFFKPDGAKMYMVGTSSDTVHQYSLATPWDLSTATYDAVSFAVGTQDSSPQGIFFAPDGIKMYMVGGTSGVVYQYSLATAWSVSSATYDSVSYSVKDHDTTPTGVFFNSDGTRLYACGSDGDAVYQWTLSTAWSLAGTVKHDFALIVGNDTALRGIVFKPDGTKLYTVGSTLDAVFQYTVSTPWDASTITYDKVYFRVGAQDSYPAGLFINPNGTKLYIIGATSDAVYQYSLAVAWDLSTATYDGVSFVVSGQDPGTAGLFFKPDGLKMYMIGATNDNVYQYTLAVAWDISTATYDGVFFKVGGQDPDPTDLFFTSDGTKMYAAGSYSDSVYPYSLATPWDISTATYDTGVAFSGASTLESFFFNPDGSRLYIQDGAWMQEFSIKTDVISDLGTIDTLNWKSEHKLSTTADDTFSLALRVMSGSTVLAAADSAGTFVDAGQITSTTDVIVGPIAFPYVNTTATKAEWNAGQVELRQTHTAAMGVDAAAIIIDHIEFTGTYTADITAPISSPTGLTAIPYNDVQMDVSWDAYTASGQVASSYDLDWSTDNATWTTVTGITTTSYSHTGLLASTAYYYRVRAVNSAGVGPYSTSVTNTTKPTPSVVRLAPDTIITQTNLTGALSTIQDDPDAPDANWMVASANVTLHLTFPTPTAELSKGDGRQEFRIQVRQP